MSGVSDFIHDISKLIIIKMPICWDQKKSDSAVTVSKVMSKCNMHCSKCASSDRFLPTLCIEVVTYFNMPLFDISDLVQCSVFRRSMYLVQSKRTHTLLLTSRGTSYNTKHTSTHRDLYRDFLINESLTVSRRSSFYVLFFLIIFIHILIWMQIWLNTPSKRTSTSR